MIDHGQQDSSVGPIRKVSFILHKFDRGGSPRVAAYLARGFRERGVEVELVMFTSRGEVDEAITHLAGGDVEIRFLGNWSGPRWLDLIRGLPALVRTLESTAPDAIIAGANNAALVSAVARRFAGLRQCRLFLKTTNPIATSRHKGIVKHLRRWTYRKVFAGAAGVWTLSRSETVEMQLAFPEFTSLFRDVYNPYVTEQMLDWNVVSTSSAGAPFVLAVGRLTKQKRLERLIQAFASVKDLTIRLKIYGEGEERGPLTALVDRLGLSNRVDMPGYIDNLGQAYANAKLLVLTSDYEGLPAVLLEAMAANCPVLSTDCFPAARAILEGADGCAIIERTDPATIAAMIDTALLAPRPTGLRQIAECYSIENGIESHWAAMHDQMSADLAP